MRRNTCAADVRPANMRRPEGMHPTAAACPEAYSAAVPAKATVPSATVSAAMSATTMSATTAAAGVCFKCEKRHDDEQHRGGASAGRQHQLHGAAGLGAPH